uniref:Uncharacterized protein n=1 Tax=Pseudo-nitzschia australis TaxID=44445 RepID=A0A7S4AXA7_9STRA|mmetsp:Transcript_23291/g.49238  ORF Transcript_23291/g.49238 Transcript_23291/m.49238 type:complete len:179 (+) Transcript_23291:243-779(+)
MGSSNDEPSASTAPSPQDSSLSESAAATSNDANDGMVASLPQERPVVTIVVDSPRVPKCVAVATTKKKVFLAAVAITSSPRNDNHRPRDHDSHRIPIDKTTPALALKKITVKIDTQNDESSSLQAKNDPMKSNKNKKRYSSILSGIMSSKKKATNILVEREALRKHLGRGNFAKVDKI